MFPTQDTLKCDAKYKIVLVAVLKTKMFLLSVRLLGGVALTQNVDLILPLIVAMAGDNNLSLLIFVYDTSCLIVPFLYKY
jgi:hypothetical protein